MLVKINYCQLYFDYVNITNMNLNGKMKNECWTAGAIMTIISENIYWYLMKYENIEEHLFIIVS